MAHQTFVNYYDALNILPAASPAQIRAAYLALAKKQHPDKGGSLHAMRQLNQAYATLKIPAISAELITENKKTCP